MSGPNGTPAMLFGFGQPTINGSPTGQDFVRQLTAVFGSDAPSPTEILECVWSEEAFTTPSTGNDSQRYDLYGSPLLRTPSWDGTLHWASTETGAVAPRPPRRRARGCRTCSGVGPLVDLVNSDPLPG